MRLGHLAVTVLDCRGADVYFVASIEWLYALDTLSAYDRYSQSSLILAWRFWHTSTIRVLERSVMFRTRSVLLIAVAYKLKLLETI